VRASSSLWKRELGPRVTAPVASAETTRQQPKHGEQGRSSDENQTLSATWTVGLPVPSAFANTKLCGALRTLEGRDAIQRDLDRLERWTYVNLVKFSKARCKILHMDWGNPKPKYRLSGEWIESSSEEKDLRVLVDKELNMTQQCMLAARRPTVSWAASKAAWPAGQGRGFSPSTPLW